MPPDYDERIRRFVDELPAVLDRALTQEAWRKHPRARNWWGRRTLEGKHGARCYLCDEFIATWSSRWPITERAQFKIAVHRESHIRELLDGSQTEPEE